MKKTNRLIALLLAFVMLLSLMVVSLSSCKDKNKPDGGNNPPASDNTGNNGTTNEQKQTYTVSVVTKGGMAMADLPVYVYEYEDGALGDMIDGGYGATDANGVVSFKLPKGGNYAVRIDSSVPEGYDVERCYPLLGENTPITISSSVISETSLAGVSYNLGSIIRDFSVTTTTGEVFTLSEALKEKDAVVINFWYTTCSWCITEFPYMQTVYEKYSDDIAIIAIDPFSEDTMSAIRNFKEDMGLTFDMGQDLYGLSTAFDVQGYPTSVIVDRYGMISLIEAGALTTERAFELVFDHFVGDDYEQKLIYSADQLIPKEKPVDKMPPSDEIAEFFEKEDLGDVVYRNDEEDEYSWPFLTGMLGEGEDAIKCIYTSNSKKESSYAQMIFDIELEAGEVLAFDYFASTELGADILYVIVNEKDIYSISGNSVDWQTCYAFVAEETDTYEVALIYMKDSSDDDEVDCVFLKDLRVVTEDQIDSPTYIYRFAATNPDKYNDYQDFAEIFMGSDGYYHVGSATGPILLADLMGYTRFSAEDYVYNMCLGKPYEYDLTRYCSYASNSAIYGLSPVTEELKELLINISRDFGSGLENEWLEICCYYDAYGTEGKQLVDPIKGLSLFSAFDVILSQNGDTDFPNSIVYDRVIMPRGLLYKFSPEQSGTYLITSSAKDPANPGQFLDTNAWIFTEDGFEQRQEWYTYSNVDRNNDVDYSNCYMMVYFEAGKDYYIDIAYYDVYQEGTINFRVERLGGEGYYRFTLASPGYFTTHAEQQGGMGDWLIHGGIDVVLGEDGIWREKRTDGREGSILYADFTKTTPIFTNHSLERMIELGSFDFSRSEGDQYILNFLALNDNDPAKCDAYLREIWGDTYEEYAEIYKLQDVYAGIYHGNGQDYTALAKSYLSKVIKAGYNAQLNETIAADDPRIGCVVVTKELSDLLQILMDKYTLVNGTPENPISIENSWTKLCYYTQYFCAATPH